MKIRYRNAFCILFVLIAAVLVGCSGFSPAPPAETPSPIAINLLDGKTGVPVDSTFKYTFSQPVITSTVNTQTYFIVPSPAPTSFEETCNVEIALDAAVSCTTDMECFLQPVSNLEYNTPYAICLTTDILYQTMERFEGFAVRFTTEETGPVDINSLHGAANVPIDSSFRYRFTNMPDKNSVSASTFFLVPDTSGSLSPTTTFSEALCNLENAIPAEIACTDWSCTLTPVNLLTNATNYAVCLSSAIHYIGAIAKSIEYIEPIFDFEGFMAQFATVSGAGPEPTPVIPTVTAKIVRLDGTKLNLTDRPIPLRISIEFTISEAITKPEDRAKFESAITLLDNLGSKVNGAFVWGADGFTVVFTPNVTLNYRTQYTIAVDQEMLPIFDLSKSPIDTSMKFVTMTRGDITGDGVPDVIVSTAPSTNSGIVYVFSGATISGVNNAQQIAKLHGAANNDFFGIRDFLNTDDFNDDGFADLIICAYGANSFKGAAYIFSGKQLSGEKGPDDAATIINGNGHFCGSAANVGDIDRDGINDILIGSMSDSVNIGAAYLFSGAEIFHTVSSTDSYAAIFGTTPSAYFGDIVMGIGDLDQDGTPDVMVTADTPNPWPGAVYVFSGVSLTKTTTTADAIANVRGETDAIYFGRGLDGVGDLNGDGIPDVVISNPFYPRNIQNGATYYFDGITLLGCPSRPAGYCVASDADAIIVGDAPHDGLFRATSLGDIDGDGVNDLALNSPTAGSTNGAAYIFSGATFPTATSLSDARTVIIGETDYYIWPLVGVGDITGDGLPDLGIGATGYNVDRGAAFFFSGTTLMTAHSLADAIAEIDGGATDVWFGIISGVGND